MKSTILITGVSTGIGLATAKFFLQQGNWHVYGSVRHAGDAGALNQVDQFSELVFDVTDKTASKQAIESIASNGHVLSVVVINAGIAVSGPLEVMPATDIRKQFEVNVFGALETIQNALPQLHATRNNHPDIPVRIINITSVSAIVSSPFTALYSAGKSALESITDGLRRELLTFNIDCVSIAPGPVKTPIWNKALERKHVYQGTRYEFVLDNLEEYVKNTEKEGMDVSEIAQGIYDTAVAQKPQTFRLMMEKKWFVAVLRWLPTRLIDKLIWKKIDSGKRY